MIKVLIERRLKEGKSEALPPLLRELRGVAMHYPGYITGETLADIEDKPVILVISTGSSLEDWQAWQATETRARLYKQIEPLLVEKPKVKLYQVMATEQK